MLSFMHGKRIVKKSKNWSIFIIESSKQLIYIQDSYEDWAQNQEEVFDDFQIANTETE